MTFIKHIVISTFFASSNLFLASTALGESGGLVAHYPFDEGSGSVVRDASGNGNDGAIHGATYAKVTEGFALQFDGLDDYVQIPSSEGLKIDGPLTVEIWANTRFSSSGPVLAKNGCSTLRQNYIIQLQEGGINFAVVDCTDQKGVENTVRGPAIAADHWHHIVGSYDGDDLKLYINGVASVKKFGKFTPGTHDGSLYVGVNYYGHKLGSFFAGQIDDLRVYDRALSQEEILANYQTGKKLRTSKLAALLSLASDFSEIDTTPPTVNLASPAPDSTVGNDRIISAKFADADSGIDESSAQVFLDGQDVTSKADISTQGFTFHPSKPLAAAVHRVEVTVSDNAGNRSNRLSWLFGVDVPVVVEAKFEDGVFLVNGEPYFPMGIYAGSAHPDNSHLPYMAQAAAAGINYHLTGQNTGPPQLNKLLAHGMKALKQVNFAAAALGKGDTSQLEDVLITKDHPALLGYWVDYSSQTFQEMLVETYDFLKQRDRHHPVIFMYEWAGRISDAYYVYDYPILNPLRENNELIELIAVNPALEAAAEEGKDKQVWYISQAFDYRSHAAGAEKIATLDGGFRPSREELRVMNYLALAFGVKGLLYYSAGVAIPDTQYISDIAIHPRQWTEALKVAREVRHLAPILAAGRPIATVGLKQEVPGLHYRELVHEGVHTLIAVNAERELALAEWVFDSAAQPKVLFENRVLAQKSGAMADMFRSLEVHVYQWKQQR